MTDKQIRDRIMGVLSASMMPMEMEAECVAFLDRCLQENRWYTGEELPPMHTETYEDPYRFDEISAMIAKALVEGHDIVINADW